VLEYYLKNGSINTNIYYCKNCGVYWREFSDIININDHFDVAGYTNIKQEDVWKNKRYTFFNQIMNLVDKYSSEHKNNSKVLLDYGCSYGHLMDIASMLGYNCIGIEIVDYLREKLDNTYKTYKTLDYLTDNSIDVITSIDSIYYSREPYDIMNQFSRILKNNGLLIIRITNRNYYIKIKKFLKKIITTRDFGDLNISLNDRSIKLLSKKTGFKIRKIIYHEEKPRQKELFLRIGYGLLPFICKITGLKMTPGLIYVLKKL
jgi:SAM-dependent methyltransferase